MDASSSNEHQCAGAADDSRSVLRDNRVVTVVLTGFAVAVALVMLASSLTGVLPAADGDLSPSFSRMTPPASGTDGAGGAFPTLAADPAPSLVLSPSAGPSAYLFQSDTVTATATGFSATDTSISVASPSSQPLCTITVGGGSGGGTCSFVPSWTNGFAFSVEGTSNTVTATGSAPAMDSTTATFTGTVALTTGQAADLVIGQPGFTSSTCSYFSDPTGGSAGECGPTGIAFDADGNLWVVDSVNNRVLEYVRGSSGCATFCTGMAASVVIGQPNFTSTSIPSPPTSSSLNGPFSIAFDTAGDLWVSDQDNSRILEFVPGSVSGCPTDQFCSKDDGLAASVVIGQSGFTTSAYDYGSFTATGLTYPEGIAFDHTGDLWVADLDDNRVLEFNPGSISGCPSASGIALFCSLDDGMAASVVVGQSSFTTGASAVSATGLSGPNAVTFDAQGDLWVADGYRVLEFVPGSVTGCSTDQFCASDDGLAASVVIGQSSFTGTSSGTSATELNGPIAVAFDPSGDLWVVDLGNNRVLEFVPGTSGCPADEFCDAAPNGMAASLVIGQTSPTSDLRYSDASTASTGVLEPEAVAFDSSGDLWVADYGNNRVLEYGAAPPSLSVNPSSGPSGTQVSLSLGGLAPETSYYVYLDPVEGSATDLIESLLTDSTGSYSGNFVAPTLSVGPYFVDVFDALGNYIVTQPAQFTISEPSLSIYDEATSSSTTGSSGDSATVTGAGLAPGTSYALYLDASPELEDNLATSFTTLGVGSYSGTFSIPSVTEGPGTYSVDLFEEISGDYVVSASAPFTVSGAQLVLTPSAGPDGTTVTATGSGFPTSSTAVELNAPSGRAAVTICSLSSGSIAGPCSFVAGAGGTFGFSLEGTSNLVTATSNSCAGQGCSYSGPAESATFIGTIAMATISPASGPVGEPITLTGSGLAANTAYTIYFDESAGTPETIASPSSCTNSGGLSASSITTDSVGDFVCTASDVDIFEELSGNFITSVTTPSSGQFSVSTPAISLSPSHGPVGALYSVTASGFSPSSGATVSFSGVVQAPTGCSDGTSVGSTIGTDGSGSFLCTFSVPNEVGGSYPISAVDVATGATAVPQPFVVSAGITTEPLAASPGAIVTAYGSGFAANSLTSLVFHEPSDQGSSTVCEATTDSQGGFSCTFAVPAPLNMQYGYVGSAKLVATDSLGDTAIAPFDLTLPYPVYLLGVVNGGHSLGAVTVDKKFGFLLDEWSLTGTDTLNVEMDYASGGSGSLGLLTAFQLQDGVALNLYGIASGPAIFLNLAGAIVDGCQVIAFSEAAQTDGTVLVSASFYCKHMTFVTDSAVAASSATPPYFLFQAAGISSPTTNGQTGFVLESWEFTPETKNKGTLSVAMYYAGGTGTNLAFYRAAVDGKIFTDIISEYFEETSQYEFELRASHALMTGFTESGQPGSLPLLSMGFSFSSYTLIDS